MRKTQVRNQQRLAFLVILFGGILLIVSAILIRRQQAVAETPAETPAAAGISSAEVPRISLDDAKARFDSDTALILDVRDPEDYQAAHIPGAISMPLSDLPARFQELPLASEILTYCT